MIVQLEGRDGRPDGEPVLACITLALACEGREVRTVEGLAERGVPHPLQDAFDRTGGAQCGFCTPGMLMSAAALLKSNPNPSDADIDAAMSGNLCRCGTYQRIRAAIKTAAAEMRTA